MSKLIRIALITLVCTLHVRGTPLGTEFRYTGFLTKNGNGVNGDYDFEATLWDAAPMNTGNNLGTVTLTKIPVNNGVFQLLLDFGAKFDGTRLWLQLRVQQNGQQNQWTPMSPRQLLTATPYALFAPTAGSANNVANNSVTTASIQNGAVVKSLNGLHDNVNLTAGANITITPQGNNLQISASGGTGGGNAWSLTGNTGTTPAANFLGTLDNQPVEMHVNALRAFRLEPAYADYFPMLAFDDAINVIGGYRDNRVEPGIVGGTIAGGGYLHGMGLAGGSLNYPNVVIGSFGTVGGGYSNRADFAAAILGGHHNAAGRFGFIGGGEANTLVLDHSFFGVIGGGSHNWVGPDDVAGSWNVTHATIGGGYYNRAVADYSTVPGGYNNWAGGRFSFAAGRDAQTGYDGSFVWNDSTGTGFSPSGDNQFAVRATGGVRLSADTELYFGAQTRQMIHLWGDTDGIGVQNRTVYFRTGGQAGRSPDADGFAWYAGGAHVDPPDDPGPAGYKLMSLRYDLTGYCLGDVPFCGLGARLDLNGSLYSIGSLYAPSFQSTSDRNQKTAFESLDVQDMLKRVIALPVLGWAFTNAPAIRHVGPMAQDFYAAFEIGMDDRHIGLADEGGVALAAIQGLNQKLEDEVRAKDAEIQALKNGMTEMRQMLDRLAAQMKGAAQ